MHSFAADVKAAERLAAAGWNVFMHPTNSKFLATMDGYTLSIDAAPAGREVESFLREFRTDCTDRSRFESIAYACLHSGYTTEEIDEVIDLLWNDR